MPIANLWFAMAEYAAFGPMPRASNVLFLPDVVDPDIALALL